MHAENSYPNREELNEIAKKLNASEKRVRSWFTNKRKAAPSNHPLANSKVFSNRQHTNEQRLVLADAYQKNKRPTHEELDALEKTTGLGRLQIQRWFRHEKAKDQAAKIFGSDSFNRKHFKPEEVLVLEQAHLKNRYTPKKGIHDLANSMGLNQMRVYNWFRTRRKYDDSYITRQSWCSADKAQILEAAYKRDPRPSTKEKEKMAKDFGVSVAQVKGWYQRTRGRYGHAHHVKQTTPQEKNVLLKAYKKNARPDGKAVAELANRLGFEKLRVLDWFSRKRSKSGAADLQRVRLEEDTDVDTRDVKVELNVKVEPMDVDDTDQKRPFN